MLKLNKIYDLTRQFKLVFIVICAVIVVVSTLFTNRLSNELALEEQKKIEIWAEATRQLISSDENVLSSNFLLQILEGNTTIPVIIVDQNDNMELARNFDEPSRDVDQYYKRQIKHLKNKRPPIEIKIDDKTSQYIYYDDSFLLTQLFYFPYIQLGIIIVFLFIAFYFQYI